MLSKCLPNQFHHCFIDNARISSSVERPQYFYKMLSVKSNQGLLILLVFSQFAGTSLWFAGNAVIDSLPGISPENFAGLTSIVQAGFIAGTLLFSLFRIADRFPSNRVFFISASLASAANLLIIYLGKNSFTLFSLRFTTGFFLAGIYPVGMKIAAEIFPEKVGKSLGWLVGALVLGTSFPHFVRSQTADISWEAVLVSTSVLSFIGGIVVLLFIPRKEGILHTEPVKLFAAFHNFRSKKFRSAAFGYFGHMWELYAFWALLPSIFSYFNKNNHTDLGIYLWSFGVIAIGSFGCIVGGIFSQHLGSKKVAYYSLLVSGICCLTVPFFFGFSATLFILFTLIWGFAVTADSPQFSAMVANSVDEKNKGTALTIVTSVGFAITIVSIHLLKELFEHYGPDSLLLLSIGPLFGLLSLKRPT